MTIDLTWPPMVLDRTGLPLGMPRLQRIEAAASAHPDLPVEALLLFAYEMRPGDLREDLIAALSIRLMASAARASSSPESVRYIGMDWGDGGVMFTQTWDCASNPVEFDDESELFAWVSNIRAPGRIADRCGECGGFQLDLRNFVGFALGEFWAQLNATGRDQSADLPGLVRTVVATLLIGGRHESVTDRQWETVTTLGLSRAQFADEDPVQLGWVRSVVYRHALAEVTRHYLRRTGLTHLPQPSEPTDIAHLKSGEVYPL